MGNSYGATDIPIQAPAQGEEITDPAISLIANYLAAILNTYATTAWQVVSPIITGLVTAPNLVTPVVRKVFGHNPEEEDFNERDLPALYLWRGPKGAQPFWLAEDWRISPDTWTMLWLFRPATQQGRRLRQSFINGIAKLVDAFIETQRDPVYVAPVDVDPTAVGADPKAASTAAVPSAIKLQIASSTSPQSYTGAALDGPTGALPFVPAQLPTVLVTGSGGSGTVTFTGLGEDGTARTSRVDLSGTGTFTGDFALSRVDEIDVSAQVDTAAALTFGLAGWVGLGSEVFVLGKFVSIEVTGWSEKIVVITMSDGSKPRSYEGIEITFKVEERWIRDITTDATPDDAAQSQFTDTPNNAYVRETALFQ